MAERIAAGDRGARDRMVVANLGLVHTIARNFTGRGLDLDDLVGEGYLGLIRATRDFDPHFGTRFSTYAAYWIKQSIRQALIETSRTIRLPAYMVGLLTKWRRAERVLRRDLTRTPSFEEVASSLGLTEAQKGMVARAQQAARLRHENSYYDGMGSRVLADAADRERSVEGRIEAEEERADALRRLDRLDARERKILALRYGLEGEAQTLKQIGSRLGVTREWVRKLELRALGHLRDA